MNQLYPGFLTFLFSRFTQIAKCIFVGSFLLLAVQTAHPQAVSGIITDYNGYWKSSTSHLNSTKPQNSHNLLAFSYNGVTYSTGVNDALLVSNDEIFSSGDFWSLPAGDISGSINSNTKVGVGQLYDGVNNGPSNPAPSNNITSYLVDGIKGMNIGTCIANLPAGNMTFLVNSINSQSIGDGIPDILVTQVADPSNSFDRYWFTNASGSQVGNYKDIVFTSITPVGTWTADFYEASSHPMVLTAGFTNTDRPIRLWAADLSEFGITVTNYNQVRNFRIGLSGNSDVAFVGYNARSFQVSSVLPVTLTGFTGTKNGQNAQLKWNTASENNTSWFIIEKSNDNTSFRAIDSVKAAGLSTSSRDYAYTDKNLQAGANYYRLKMLDAEGKIVYSTVVSLKADKNNTTFSFSPNPARSGQTLRIYHEKAKGTETLSIFNTAGILFYQKNIAKDNYQSSLELSRLTKGIYYIVWNNGSTKNTQKLLIN